MQLIPKGGVQEPRCPACGFEFETMPQRKRACPGCKVAIYSRGCPIRGKALWLEDELAGLEAAWSLQASGSQLCREGPSGELEVWVAARFGEMALQEGEGQWGLARAGWLRIAGACARRLRPALAAHALVGVIALDISGATDSPGFGAVYDRDHFERELAEFEGTEATPRAFEPADFIADPAKPWLWRPRAPIRNHDIGKLYPALLQALETFCSAATLDMQFVQRSLELHASAMMERGAMMVPTDLAWERFVVLSQRLGA